MKISHVALGFSLVEVLVALFVVSLSAVNISGLQKLVSDQSRNNFSQTTVLNLAKKRIEEIMLLSDIQKLEDLDGTASIHIEKGVQFTFIYKINLTSGAVSSSPIRDVALQVLWTNSTGGTQLYTYSQQVLLDLLLQGAGADHTIFPYVIPNLLNTTQVKHFEATGTYKKDAYVIYNSQLLQATSDHSLDIDQQGEVEPPINKDGSIVNGWQRLGQIDEPNLADLFIN